MNITDKNNDFWIRDPLILVKPSEIYKIIPTSSMSYNEKLNAITRLTILIAIIIVLYTRDYKKALIPIIIIIIIVIVWAISSNKYHDNNLTNDEKGIYQIAEPFRNTIQTDYTIEKKIKQMDRRLRRQIDDTVDETEGLAFYTPHYSDHRDPMQLETLSGDQDTFLEWVYKLPETCKENTRNCLKYIDVRYD